MEFTKLIEKIKAYSISIPAELYEDTENTYTRKINKKILGTSDFKFPDKNNIEFKEGGELKYLKAIANSIHMLNNNIDKIEKFYLSITKYGSSSKIGFNDGSTNKRKVYYIIFKFKKDAGKIMTCKGEKNNHCYFFQSDEFEISYIVVQSTNLIENENLKAVS